MSNTIEWLLSHLPANHSFQKEFMGTLDVDLSVWETVVQYMKDLSVYLDSEDHNHRKVGVSSKPRQEVVVPEYLVKASKI